MATVLVVDDNEDLRDLLALMLRRSGHTAVTAAGPVEAARRLAGDRVDAVVLDVRLGAECGLRLCRALRAGPATAHLPVVLVSGDGSAGAVAAGRAAGADDFVTKPFGPTELVARVEAVLAVGVAA